MAGDFEHRIVYRRDERGVILDSAVVGPDDEMPEGFEDSAEYQTLVQTEQERLPVEESRLTTWEGVDLSQSVDVIKAQAEAQEGPASPAGLEDEDVRELAPDSQLQKTDEVVTADDGSSEFGSDQTVDDVKEAADAQEGDTDPRGEQSAEEDGEDDEKSESPRRGRRRS